MNRLKLLVAFLLLSFEGSSWCQGDTFDLASFTFDDALSPTTVSPVAPDVLGDYGSFSAQFIPVSEEGNDFNPDLSLGTLLLGSSGTGGLSVILGDDLLRQMIDVSWGGAAGVTNQDGDDFVVYENGSPGGPEAYMVAVRETGSANFTDFRYEFADDFFNAPPPGTDIAQVLSTGFDLSSFGLDPDATIDAIRIGNLQFFDTVDEEIGQGNVTLNGGGGFAPLTGPQGNGGEYNAGGLDPDVTYVGVLALATTPGDFNGDGNVNGDDFLIWQSSFQNDAGGDADGDGDTDGDDFLLWQTNFGGSEGASSASVPEPASSILFALLALALSVRRVRRRC